MTRSLSIGAIPIPVGPIRAILIVSVSALALAACAGRTPPPSIAYDGAAFQAAVIETEPPRPVEVVTIAEPLPLPGQLLPPPSTRRRADKRPPTVQVDAANKAALQEPNTHGYINAIQVYPYTQGALYRLYAAPERVSDIALQPGETLTAVSAGDTVRWVIGDTTSGSGETRRVHVLVKPFAPDLKTNLVITTDRRTYHLQLESTERTADGGDLLDLSAGPDPGAAATERERPRRRCRLPAAWRWRTCGSATPSPATARPGGRCAPSTTAPRSSSSSPHGSTRARRRRSSWSVPRATTSSSTTGSGATTTSSTACSPPPNCASGPIRSRSSASAVPTDVSGGVASNAGPRPRTGPLGGEDMSDTAAPRRSLPSMTRQDPGPAQATPRRTVRFKRKLLIGIAAVACGGVLGVTWLALQGPGMRLGQQGQELYNTERKPTPEGLAGLPGDYGQMRPDTPQLGPPLPGDLGGPILERQRQLGIAPGGSELSAEEQRLAQQARRPGRPASSSRSSTGRASATPSSGGPVPAPMSRRRIVSARR